MKKNIIYLSLIFALTIFVSCESEKTRTPYPHSLPTVEGTVHETEITFGDSITLTAEVADNVTPLSTLEVKIVVNDMVISKESVRTKGNQATYTQRYHIPFGPYMPESSDVEVHLTSINVEGNETTEIISNTTGKRPIIPGLYLTTSTGSKQFTLTDEEHCIYTLDNQSYGQELSFLLPTKITKYQRVDWTGMVFGGSAEELDIVKERAENITLSDKTIMGFNKITVDLLNFTVTGEGEKLVPITEMNLANFTDKSMNSTNSFGTSTTETWKTANVYLGKDTEFTTSGFTATTIFAPDFFEASGNKVKFLGDTDAYTVYYLPSADYVFVENPNAKFPDALWLCGIGFGPATKTYGKTASWNWNTPLEYAYCRQISTGVYQTTIYIQHDIESGEKAKDYTLNAKFFEQRGWGGEIDSKTYDIKSTLIQQATDTADAGNFTGTTALSAAPGIYILTIDTTKKTIELKAP